MDKHILVTARVGHNKLIEPIIVRLTLEKKSLEAFKKCEKLEDYIKYEAANHIVDGLEIIKITERELNESEEYLANIRENKEFRQ